MRFCSYCGAPLPAPPPVTCAVVRHQPLAGRQAVRGRARDARRAAAAGAPRARALARALGHPRRLLRVRGAPARPPRPGRCGRRRASRSASAPSLGMWMDSYAAERAGRRQGDAQHLLPRDRGRRAKPTSDPNEVAEIGWFAPDELPRELAFPGHVPAVLRAWKETRSWRGCLPRLRSPLRARAEDEPRAALPRQVRPRPREQHDEAVAEADQEEDVDEEPRDPGDEARRAAAGRRSPTAAAAADRSRASPCRGSGTARAARRAPRAGRSRAAWWPIWIAAGATPGTGRPSCSSEARSPITKTSGWPGTVRSGGDAHAPGPVERAPRATAPRGEAATPAAQTTVRAAIAVGADVDAALVDAGHRRAGPDLHAELLELPLRLLREVLGVGGEQPRARLDQDHAGHARVDAPEVARRACGARSRRRRRPSRRRSGPPPTTTNVSHCRTASRSVSRSACSKASSTRRRISSASSRLFRPGAWRAHSSWPKYECVGAGRRARGSRRASSPVARRDAPRARGRPPSTSASSTRVFFWRRRMRRIGEAMSAGDSPAVATW